MATPFEQFIIDNMPLKGNLLNPSSAEGYDGDPNDPSAPGTLVNAKIGIFYHQYTPSTLWQKGKDGTWKRSADLSNVESNIIPAEDYPPETETETSIGVQCFLGYPSWGMTWDLEFQLNDETPFTVSGANPSSVGNIIWGISNQLNNAFQEAGVGDKIAARDQPDWPYPVGIYTAPGYSLKLLAKTITGPGGTPPDLFTDLNYVYDPDSYRFAVGQTLVAEPYQEEAGYKIGVDQSSSRASLGFFISPSAYVDFDISIDGGDPVTLDVGSTPWQTAAALVQAAIVAQGVDDKIKAYSTGSYQYTHILRLDPGGSLVITEDRTVYNPFSNQPTTHYWFKSTDEQNVWKSPYWPRESVAGDTRRFVFDQDIFPKDSTRNLGLPEVREIVPLFVFILYKGVSPPPDYWSYVYADPVVFSVGTELLPLALEQGHTLTTIAEVVDLFNSQIVAAGLDDKVEAADVSAEWIAAFGVSPWYDVIAIRFKAGVIPEDLSKLHVNWPNTDIYSSWGIWDESYGLGKSPRTEITNNLWFREYVPYQPRKPWGGIEALVLGSDRAEFVGVSPADEGTGTIERDDSLAFGGVTAGAIYTEGSGYVGYWRGDNEFYCPPFSAVMLGSGDGSESYAEATYGGAVLMGSTYAFGGGGDVCEIYSNAYGSFSQGYALTFGLDGYAASGVNGGEGAFVQGYAVAYGDYSEAELLARGSGSFVQGYAGADDNSTANIYSYISAYGAFVQGMAWAADGIDAIIYNNGSGAFAQGYVNAWDDGSGGWQARIYVYGDGCMATGMVDGCGEIISGASTAHFGCRAGGYAHDNYKIRAEGLAAFAWGDTDGGNVEALGNNCGQFGVGTNNENNSTSYGTAFRFHHAPVTGPTVPRNGDFWVDSSTGRIWVYDGGAATSLVGAVTLVDLAQDIVLAADATHDVGKKYTGTITKPSVQGAGATWPITVLFNWPVWWKVNGLWYHTELSNLSDWYYLSECVNQINTDPDINRHWFASDVGGQLKLDYVGDPDDVVEIPEPGPGYSEPFDAGDTPGSYWTNFLGPLGAGPTPDYNTEMTSAYDQKVWREVNSERVYARNILEVGRSFRFIDPDSTEDPIVRPGDITIRDDGELEMVMPNDGPWQAFVQSRWWFEESTFGSDFPWDRKVFAQQTPGVPNGLAELEDQPADPDDRLAIGYSGDRFYLNRTAVTLGEKKPFTTYLNGRKRTIATCYYSDSPTSGQPYETYGEFFGGIGSDGSFQAPEKDLTKYEEALKRGAVLVEGYSTTPNFTTYMGVRAHPPTMDGATREWIDAVWGLRWLEGLEVSYAVGEGDGTLDSDVALHISDGKLQLGDLKIDVLDNEQVSMFNGQRSLDWPLKLGNQDMNTGTGGVFLEGVFRYWTGGKWWVTNSSSTGYLRKGFAYYQHPDQYSGARLPINVDLGGDDWGWQEVASGNFVNFFIVATNDFRVALRGITGQVEYASLSDAERGMEAEFRSIIRQGLPFKHFVPVAGVCLQTDDSYTNSYKARIRTLSNGSPAKDFRGVDLFQPSDNAIATSRDFAEPRGDVVLVGAGTYVLSRDDWNKVLVCTGGPTIEVPSSIPPAFFCRVYQSDGTQPTIAAGSGATLNKPSTWASPVKTKEQYAYGEILAVAEGVFTVGGQLA